jgi:hypothetical protein
MGIWGTGPFDNDGAAETVAKLMEPCRKISAATSNREAQNYYAEARVGIQVRLLANETDILGGTSLQLGLDALQHMRADKAWISFWKEPKGIAAALDKEIAAVKLAMKPKSARRVTRKKRAK